jgi:hypothetical protein
MVSVVEGVVAASVVDCGGRVVIDVVVGGAVELVLVVGTAVGVAGESELPHAASIDASTRSGTLVSMTPLERHLQR